MPSTENQLSKSDKKKIYFIVTAVILGILQPVFWNLIFILFNFNGVVCIISCILSIIGIILIFAYIEDETELLD